ncbi:MAG: amidohydrolase family protein [Desulfobacca sp.]|uniref:amidohydrolase family protein n=1 Tax=Desulfobacca sp. TaxID=2067990 RepID=UPI00404B4E69
MSLLPCIDSHLHCGVQHVAWPWEKVRTRLLAAAITGAGLIPPVEDIYDRHDPAFVDHPTWQECRRKAHRYLRSLQDPSLTLYPYFFVWNDFAWEDLSEDYAAIKWHRHDDEPEYRYEDPRCREFLAKALALRLPILLEESLTNTLSFIQELAPTATVIIPHLGMLNGGYRRLKDLGVWELPQVYADTALAGPADIMDYIRNFGATRLLLGSDFPFGDPVLEKDKVLSLNLPAAVHQAILAENWLRLQAARQTAAGR